MMDAAKIDEFLKQANIGDILDVDYNKCIKDRNVVGEICELRQTRVTVKRDNPSFLQKLLGYTLVDIPYGSITDYELRKNH